MQCGRLAGGTNVDEVELGSIHTVDLLDEWPWRT